MQVLLEWVPEWCIVLIYPEPILTCTLSVLGCAAFSRERPDLVFLWISQEVLAKEGK